MKVTKREVLFSIIIAVVWLILGLIIADNINANSLKKQQTYNTALQIDYDADLFSYGMRTDIGSALAYGTLSTLDTVSYPEIDGEYAYIKRVREEYTMHIRYGTDSKGNSYQEIYYTWDEKGKDVIHCDTISFLNNTFTYGTITFPSTYHLDTIYETPNVRYKYYVCDAAYEGTLYAELTDGTISNTTFYEDYTIDETIELIHSEGEVSLIIFWILWIIGMGIIIFLFYYLDNNWLEDKRKRTSYY